MGCVEEGSEAPDFELMDQGGRLFRLSSVRGRYVVLYFYPKAMTSGCTIEAVGFRDHYQEITSLNTVVIGVSRDGVEDIKKFADKYDLPFILLADPEGRVIETYCVKGPRGFARRVTFLIDDRGVVIKKWGRVDPKNHALEVIEFLRKRLGINK